MFNPSLFFDDIDFTEIEVVEAIYIDLKFITKLSPESFIIWGDGATDRTRTNHNHTYATPYTGKIKLGFLSASFNSIDNVNYGATQTKEPNFPAEPDIISGGWIVDGTKLSTYKRLEKFSINNTSPKTRVVGDWSSLPDTLVNFSFIISIPNANFETPFDLSYLKPNMKVITIYQTSNPNKLTGDISHVPPSCTVFRPYGSNIVTGDIVALKNCNDISIQGTNTVYGDIAHLTTSPMSQIMISGYNTITGDIAVFDNCLANTLQLLGYNTIYGTVNKYPNVLQFSLTGNNTVSGNLNTTLDLPKCGNINISGNSTIVIDIPSSSIITSIDLRGNVKLNSLGVLSSCTTFKLASNYGIVTLDILSKLPMLSTFNILDGSGINIYTTGVFNNRLLAGIQIEGISTLTSEMIDLLLNDLTTATWITKGYRYVQIRGMNQPRTSASDSAVAYLISIGVDVSTN